MGIYSTKEEEGVKVQQFRFCDGMDYYTVSVLCTDTELSYIDENCGIFGSSTIEEVVGKIQSLGFRCSYGVDDKDT